MAVVVRLNTCLSFVSLHEPLRACGELRAQVEMELTLAQAGVPVLLRVGRVALLPGVDYDFKRARNDEQSALAV